jgi:hypothetical protein
MRKNITTIRVAKDLKIIMANNIENTHEHPAAIEAERKIRAGEVTEFGPIRIIKKDVDNM